MNLTYIILGLCISIALIFLIYRYIYSSRVMFKNQFKTDVYHSQETTSVSATQLIHPILDSSFTYSFVINLHNFYEDYNYWRHIFHKGTLLHPTIPLKYTFWNNIEIEMPEQSIGVWMHPSINTLRIAMTTKDHYSNYYLETIDIPNIHQNTSIMITVVVENKIISIYKNGRLVISYGCLYYPEFNKKDLYIFHKHTIDGSLSNFTYIPKPLYVKDIEYLYNTHIKKE